MVLKNKMSRDRVKSSALSNKKRKQEYKGKRKDNYPKKKKQMKMSECNICFSSVEETRDNTISCGKVSHTICGDCKIRMKDSSCPMCRSHNVPQPIAQDVKLKIYQGLKKPHSEYESDPSRMRKKQIRAYNRTGPYWEPFGENTNRLIRNRRQAIQSQPARQMLIHPGTTAYYGLTSGWIRQGETGQRVWFNYDDNGYNGRWLTDEEVAQYNGNMDNYDDDTETTLSLGDVTVYSDYDSDSDSDSVTTLELTDGSDEEYDVDIELNEHVLNTNDLHNIVNNIIDHLIDIDSD